MAFLHLKKVNFYRYVRIASLNKQSSDYSAGIIRSLLQSILVGLNQTTGDY